MVKVVSSATLLAPLPLPKVSATRGMDSMNSAQSDRLTGGKIACAEYPPRGHGLGWIEAASPRVFLLKEEDDMYVESSRVTAAPVGEKNISCSLESDLGARLEVTFDDAKAAD